MPRRDLIWPFGGRADSAAHADLPALFTDKARNVRNRDPVSGRIRGATRSMLTRWNEDAIGASRIKALVSTAFDTRKVDFSYTPGSETVAWATATPSKTDCLAGVTDQQGNVYALDGNAGIVKYNSAGRQIMKIALPVLDPSHVVRALWVDETDRIFAGVSEGGDVRTARVFCILQLPDDQYLVLWTLEPGAYTEDLRLHRGTQLYAAHNYALENKARVVIYESLGLSPVETKRIEDSLAYPITSMDVLDGFTYCSSNTLVGDARTPTAASTSTFEKYRLGHPSARGFHPHVVGWTPKQLENASRRIWSWYRAQDIDETDLEQTGTEATMDEGQQILRWRDISGHDRHWYSGALFDADEKGPKYTRVGPGGRPALRFLNDSTTTKNSMVTLANASISKSQADQQRTAIPAYEGAMWAMFILFRPTLDDVAGTDPRVVWSAENDAPGVSDHGLWVNRACGGVQPGTFSLGRVSYFATTDAADDGNCAAADQSDDYAYSGSISRHTDTILVTILWDGAVDSAGGTTKTRCTFRVNGAPVDRFTGTAFQSLLPNYLAYAPTVGNTIANRLRGEIVEMLVIDRTDRFDDSTEPKVLTHDLIDFVDDHPLGGAPQTDNEMTRIESYMMHNAGIGHALGGGTVALAPQDKWTHPYGQLENLGGLSGNADHGPSSPPDYDGAGRSTALSEITRLYPLISKHDEQGRLLWVCSEETHPDTGNDRGGIGYGVRARKIESDGIVHVWSVGPDAIETTTGDVAVRKIIDLGATFSGSSGDGAWRYKFTSNRDYDYEHPKMAADKFGNLFLPYFETDAAAEWSLLVFKKDGVAGVGQVLVDFLLPDSQQAHAVAIPPDALVPDYRDGLTDEMSPHVFLFTQAGSSADLSVHRLDLVQLNSSASGNPEDVITLAVVDTDVRAVTPTTNSIVSGGSAVIDGTSQFVQAIRAGEDLVISDGKSLLAYNLRDATLEPLVSTSAGEVPGPARLIMFWRHRLFLALDGGQYAASRLGRIRDWNLRPGSTLSGIPRQTSTQAFTGTITRAGEAEDSIVALIPVWDDLAYLVGKTRILRLTGDPQDGGQIHVVGNSTGGVFGDSHCMDDQGRVFLWGRDPRGLYILPPVGDLVPLTDKTLEASDFQDIDMTTHRMMLAWDPDEHVVRVFQVAWASSTVVAHWAWEERSHRLVRAAPIWQDRYQDEGLQPTAYAHLGGEDENGLIVGCEDGVIRFYDPEGRTDDGTACDAFVVFELSTDLPQHRAMRLTEIEIVLAADQEGCVAELFVAETAERLGPIVASRTLKPGRNTWKVRLKGPHMWLRLRNAAAGRWSFEEGSYQFEDGGVIRGRAV